MTSHAAVAAAIRQRLIEGRPAPLRGLGTLVRQHVASRIEERPDGTRVLLPPGETIGLAAEAVREESLADAYARFRGVDDAEAEGAYAAAMDQIEARLAATGEVRLPGVGLLRRTSGGIVLGVEADLLQAVNRTYEGLPPVAAGPTPEPAAPPPPAAPSPPRRPPPPPAAPPVERVPPSDPDPAPPSPPTSATSAPEPPQTEAPEPPPVSPAAASFADGPPAFGGFRDEPGDVAGDVDDDLLDDVVSDAMPAPFGDPGGRPLADLLPPTPPERRPPPEAPPSAPSSTVDDWGEETWTAPAFDDAPLRDDDDFGRPVAPTADPFEDADFDVVPSPPAPMPPEAAAPEPPPAEPDAAPASEPLDDGPPPVAAPEPPPLSPDVVFAQALGPEEGVEVEPPTGAAVPIEPPPVDAPVPAPEPVPEADDEDTGGRTAAWLWALFVVLLVAALAAAAFWFWPEVERALFPRLGTPTEQPADAGPRTVSADAGSAGDPAAGPAAADSEPGATPAPSAGTALASQPAGGGAAPRPASPDGPPVASASSPAADGRALAPPPDQAILPPVLAGLDAADRDALSGRDPIDPEAAAWTLVVLSTPSRADAAALVGRYRQAGYRASVLETVAGSRPMFRVAVGQFPDRDAAIRLRDRLPPQAPPDTWALDLQTL